MNNSLRVLVFGPDQALTRSVLDALVGAGMTVDPSGVTDWSELREALAEGGWELLITDHRPPELDALSVVLMARGADPDLPVIVVAHGLGASRIADLIRGGAEDALGPDTLERLAAAVQRARTAGDQKRQYREALEALQKSEARFRSIASSIPGMVFEYTRDDRAPGRFLFVSENATALFALPARALVADASAALGLIVEEDRPSFDASLNDSARRLTVWNWEGRIRLPESTEIKWINVRASPRSGAARTVTWTGIMANITQGKLAEQEIKRSREQLVELSSHIERVKEEERASISREIHDDIGGTLTAIKIELLWLMNRLPKERADMLARAESIQTLVDRVIEATGRISRALRPGILDFGLVPAIEWQAMEFQNRMGIVCDVECESDDLELDAERATALFRIFQETLTNISKHAAATEVHASLQQSEGRVTLVVADNGRGITDGDMAKPKSFGIRGILERCRSLGGEAYISGQPGNGTTVEVSIPVEDTTPEIDQRQQALL